MARRVLVVGGGVFGIASALELRRRGWDVDVLDPGPLPHPRASSTDVSKIVRMDYGADDLMTALAAEAMEGWERWNEEWPRPLFHPTGFLLLSRGAMVPGTFEWESLVRVRGHGPAPERLDAASLARRYPAWRPGVHAEGYLSPRAGWAESGAVMAWLVRVARDAGVRTREGVAVEGLLEDDARVRGVRTRTGERLEADRVVVAAGAWTPSLLPWLGDVMRTVGQPVLHFRPEEPERWGAPAFPTWAADIARTGWYGFPALPDGRVKVGHHGAGLAVHPDAPDRVPDPAVERCRAFLEEALPELAGAPLVERRLCLYCDTFDGDFFIGPDPDRDGLVVAAGGSGHGFKFAPVLGPIVADALEGRENPWGPRFRWRAAGPGGREHARHGGDA